MPNCSWHSAGLDEVLLLLDTNRKEGLSLAEVSQRQKIYSNSLEEDKRLNPLILFINQFTDTMVLVLLGATVISGLIGAMADAITIMAIVVLNASLGFIQEYRAERSLEEIKKLASPFALVLRAGRRIKVSASELVPGDIVFLETGDKVPADLRLLESFSLEIDEAILTGESLPVNKNHSSIIPESTPLAERKNMAFMGTVITRGRARAVIVTTGMHTVVGQIAKMMKDTERPQTPLQMRLDQLGKTLIVICLLLCTLVTLLGIYRGENVMVMLMAGISLAVAAIPEGLPAIVTVVLALGVQKMARRNAIIRKLPAVETLGCTTVICSDKTGTLTQNQMTVGRLATIDRVMEITGNGYESRGSFHHQGNEVNPLSDMNSRLIMQVALNCNNATLEKIKGSYQIQGDPTEASLLVMAEKAGMTAVYKRLKEIPFDSSRKKMSIVVEADGDYFVFAKGALEVLMPSCSRVIKQGQAQPLLEKDRRYFSCLQEQWAEEALRILGFAAKKISVGEIILADDLLESNLTLLGICGMSDPPRNGVEKSVAACLNAGIVPIMITGDHPATARAIARKIGISESDEVISGSELEHLTEQDLYRKSLTTRVFARVAPEQKNRIVEVLKKHREVVAMTGDGVNDAPALKSADIGIAMGISGTEVSREASSMILADDDFSTIISAVYEGRAIYDNIRKFIRYLLGCNIGEVLVMFLASVLGMPLPLIPIQILWVNLVTDGLPAMALGLEPPEPEIMKRKPRAADEGIFARRLGWMVLSRGFYISIVTLLAFTIALLYSRLNGIDPLPLSRSMAFTTLVVAQLFYVFECRSEKYSAFELGFFKNKFLLLAVFCSISMHLMVLYIPWMQGVFNSVGLNCWQWAVILLLTGWKFILRLILHLWKRVFAFKWDYVKINA
ncbi:MAG: calcium-translocating P-type ATPase, SERCA-type [Syntrophomonas sp.]|uniref:calcium-translocating P-type ATPase, SERCA-type n=1 Tax=Syntrophomonas sp. TaxID=2053627 RepID=UPI002609BBD2|nr:calcium-translocating P-type ATPase, SERCA-type [Syntrophomonas sp.]MDD2509718.1 calcium-translocating P-type ATPase, SERCA-type [Syntrophomonas sp.]MDD3879157.1 calcium-translocating P-type ATPase, SERCA-type [Syntrophomonas sp.]MDD4625850.1 calcium-translocating P-type ATPase, SERCA-type [Syntrophomonas sp.]